jgi:hypothetical protein
MMGNVMGKKTFILKKRSAADSILLFRPRGERMLLLQLFWL